MKFSHDNRFYKFILVGVYNTVFGWVIFSLFIFLGFHPSLSLLISTAAGAINNFYSIGGVVFKNLLLKNFWKFTIAYVGVYLANTTVLQLTDKFLNPILAQFLLAPFMAVFSYLIMIKFVFKNKENQ